MTDSLVTYSDTLIFNPKLSNLKPIILPEPVKFEPLTAGWYILFGLIVLLLFLLAYNSFKKFRSRAYRRLSVRELKKLIPEIGISNTAGLIMRISTILKVTALKSFSRDKVANLSGTNWQNFLISSCPSGSYSENAFVLIDLQYIPETENRQIKPEDINKLVYDSIKWIQGHRV